MRPEMTIPEIRARLFEKAKEHNDPELAYLAEQTHRRRPVRTTARPSSMPMTPERATAIRVYAEEHPEATMFDIGRLFRVNQGRVSEVLAGFRGEKP